MGDGLLTIDEAARLTGLSPDMIRSRIGSGDLRAHSVEVDGESETRVLLDDVRRLTAAGPDGATVSPPRQEEEPAQAGELNPDREAVPPSAALMSSPAPASTEVRELAVGLAAELFQRWELAMDQRFRAELQLRLEAALAHREHQARDLGEEVEQRRKWWQNPWRTRHGPYGYETWERERTLIRQTREVAEMERQITEMHDRLRELGQPPREIELTVEPQGEVPASEAQAE